jgi:hypothetical protein
MVRNISSVSGLGVDPLSVPPSFNGGMNNNNPKPDTCYRGRVFGPVFGKEGLFEEPLGG